MTSLPILQFFVVGLSMGAVYALIALGFMTIFRASNIVNFAQGEFVMVGALLTNVFLITFHLPYLLSAVLAVMGVVLIGVALQRMVIHPIRRASVLIMIMGTLGASIIISSIPVPLSQIPGMTYLRDPFILPKITTHLEALEIAGVRVSFQRIWVVGTSLIFLVLLYLFSNYTRTGRAMEASATDPLGARLAGIRIQRMVLYSFVISAAVGAVGGILVTPIANMRYDSGVILALKGFVAAVLGGWGKNSGAVLGGFLLGVIEALCVGLIPEIGSRYQQMWAFLILLIILYFRPRGILGSEAVD
ncbi:MAG: branched-chain amino acid ABC transporter permease [Deltaproteobacteria bacterium]|nr:branched-chain amino acid ABC transporter permease [Deltaproteobacteria bacterium]